MRFPNAKQFDDIRSVRGYELLDAIREGGGRNLTVLSGGFPCQPVSTAGKRLGSKDERWLWQEYNRIICETKPSWIFAENVANLTNIPEFRGICSDLEAAGYEYRVFHIQASDAGAPHRRRRCFVIAHTMCNGLQEEHSICREVEQEFPGCVNVRGGNTGRINHVTDTCNKSDVQTDSTIYPIGTCGNTREDAACGDWGASTLPDWETYPPAICRVDDGFSIQLDKSRLQALGNAVVPRVVFPFFRAIRAIEEGGE